MFKRGLTPQMVLLPIWSIFNKWLLKPVWVISFQFGQALPIYNWSTACACRGLRAAGIVLSSVCSTGAHNLPWDCWISRWFNLNPSVWNMQASHAASSSVQGWCSTIVCERPTVRLEISKQIWFLKGKKVNMNLRQSSQTAHIPQMSEWWGWVTIFASLPTPSLFLSTY